MSSVRGAGSARAQVGAQILIAADVGAAFIGAHKNLRQAAHGLADLLLQRLGGDVLAHGQILKRQRLNLAQHAGFVAVHATGFAVNDDFHKKTPDNNNDKV